jgi:hypothetical protein
MDYEEFHAAHDEVQRKVASAELTPAELRDELLRLNDLRDTIADDLQRLEADSDLELLMMAATLPAPQVTEAQLRAIAVAEQASDPTGTPDQRVRRLRRGIADIQSIAGRVSDPSEQNAILRQAEPLHLQASAIEMQQPGLER